MCLEGLSPCDPQFALLDPSCTRKFAQRSFTAQGFSALAGALEAYLTLADGMGVSGNCWRL